LPYDERKSKNNTNKFVTITLVITNINVFGDFSERTINALQLRMEMSLYD